MRLLSVFLLLIMSVDFNDNRGTYNQQVEQIDPSLLSRAKRRLLAKQRGRK